MEESLLKAQKLDLFLGVAEKPELQLQEIEVQPLRRSDP